jgi:glyoxylase-like metal-dependent hydrolase (beta-lactamase superfamily II)
MGRNVMAHSNPTAGLAVLLAFCAASPGPAQQQNSSHIQVTPVHGNIYVISGAGGNITVQTGKDGVLLVDTGLADAAPQVIAEIRKLTTAPVLFIINTHMHPDHVGGNEAMAITRGESETGTIVPTGGGGRPPESLTGEQPLKIIAHENVLNRMTMPTGREARPPQAGLPEDEYFTPFKDLRFNGEAIIIYHEPNAHTDGDSVVLFRASDVVSAGDIFSPDGYPFIDVERGGSIEGEISALNHLLDLTVPGKTQDGGTYVIPGHGRICDEADVVEYRDMVVIIHDRIQDMIKKGMTLNQIEAAKPTRDYDTEYIAESSFVKADQFVEAIYRSLTQTKRVGSSR